LPDILFSVLPLWLLFNCNSSLSRTIVVMFSSSRQAPIKHNLAQVALKYYAAFIIPITATPKPRFNNSQNKSRRRNRNFIQFIHLDLISLHSPLPHLSIDHPTQRRRRGTTPQCPQLQPSSALLVQRSAPPTSSHMLKLSGRREVDSGSRQRDGRVRLRRPLSRTG
jgi:hypothetical protein